MLDLKTLNKTRYKFGFVNLLFQGQETGLIPIHTVIIRILGGGAVHLGICAAISTVHSSGQWIGALLLKKYNSNQRAMAASLWGGALFAFLICGFLLLGSVQYLSIYSLWGYLIFVLILTTFTGIQWNIETSWIGDLVPRQIRGWFTSVKYAVSMSGTVCFLLFFGKLSDISPHPATYAGMFLIIAISHIIGVWLVSTIKDCIPKNANFIFAGNSRRERLNYTSTSLWCYILFFVLWSSGRTAMSAFSTAYLIDYFHYSMTKIVFILAIQKIISIFLLLIMGRTSDKYGNQIPFLLTSGIVSLCMMLWATSAWWGIVPIIVYQFINGAAGHTHSMLAINYGLEIFPAKGRAGYFGFSGIFISISAIVSPIIAGKIMSEFEGFRYFLWNAEITHYHIFFAFCSLISLSCMIPLLVAGKQVVHENPD